MDGLIPIRNFAVLEEGHLYRSAQPIYKYEFEWLAMVVGVKNLINLRKESRIDERFAPSLGIQVRNLDIIDHKPPTLDQAKEFMELVRKPDPILFHCEHGRGRTSTFAVLARIARGCTLQQALDEESDVFKYTFPHLEQLQWLQETASKLSKVKQRLCYR